MTRIEFMSELENLLLDIPAEEREAALEFYEDYFEDAGPENVEDVIKHFKSPVKVAAIIKSDINRTRESKEQDILYTETGYKDMLVEEDRYEVAKDSDIKKGNGNHSSQNERAQGRSYSSEQDRGNRTSDEGNSREDHRRNEGSYRGQYPKNENRWLKALLIFFVGLIALPVIIPLIAVCFALFISAVAVMFGLFLAAAACTIAFLGSGIFLLVSGIYMVFQFPMNGLFISGIGLVMLGLGILGVLLVIVLCSKVIPALFTGAATFVRYIVRRSSRAV